MPFPLLFILSSHSSVVSATQYIANRQKMTKEKKDRSCGGCFGDLIETIALLFELFGND